MGYDHDAANAIALMASARALRDQLERDRDRLGLLFLLPPHLRFALHAELEELRAKVVEVNAKLMP